MPIKNFDVKTYCPYCKKMTGNKNVIISSHEFLKSNLEKPFIYMISDCSVCGNKKAKKFYVETDHISNKKSIKLKDGSGIIDKIISYLPFELHLIDFQNPLNPRKYSFAGPGTKLENRLDENDIPKDFSKPINDLDEAAYHHDLIYRDFGQDSPERREGDRQLMERAGDILRRKDIGWSERLNAYIVYQIMKRMAKS
jgi:hypothetical protein